MRRSSDSLAADDLARGVLRLLADMAYSGLREVSLPNARRADVMAVNRAGTIVIVEVKTSLADFRADGKWGEYLDFCDAFYFAVPVGFPMDVLPREHGLIVADRFGAAVERPAPENRLGAPRRRALTLRLARKGADRLRRVEDPPQE